MTYAESIEFLYSLRLFGLNFGVGGFMPRSNAGP
jgi:hypothetical protein